MDIRVRYNGRKNTRRWVEKPNTTGYWETVRGCPRNTLVTVRDGDVVYFGIARYDKRWGLPFSKEEGRKIAEGRAKKARRLPSNLVNHGIVYGTSIVKDWEYGYEKEMIGLYGCVGVDNVKLLLTYFDNIDSLLPRGKLISPAQRRVEELAGVTTAENYPNL